MENNFIIVAVMCVIGAGFIYTGVSMMRLRAKLIESGKRAMAMVTNINLSTRTRGTKGNKRSVTVYNCVMEFIADDGTQTVRHSTEEMRMVGDTMEIAYLPENPRKFMLASQLTDSFINKIMPVGNVVIGAILLIAAVVAAFA